MTAEEWVAAWSVGWSGAQRWLYPHLAAVLCGATVLRVLKVWLLPRGGGV